MALLWTLLIAANVLAIAAGAQAVVLLRAKDDAIAQLQGRMAVMASDADRADKQIEAQKILIEQAKGWLAAQSNVIGAAEATATKPARQ